MYCSHQQVMFSKNPFTFFIEVGYVFQLFTVFYFRCLEGLENMKTSSEAISGYSGALAAVLGGVRFSPLGVPHTKGKVCQCTYNFLEKLYFHSFNI